VHQTEPEDWDEEVLSACHAVLAASLVLIPLFSALFSQSDGEWEAPKIDNPEYKGDWKPKRIKNPAYKGKWVHPEIANPDFVEDKNLYLHKNIGAVGFDLWQVKAGTIFDNSERSHLDVS
jgi:hypothetical protein